MAVLSLTDAELAYGHVPLLDRAGFSLEAGERIGLVGRNGSGKSSLLKVLAGVESLDDGLVQRQEALTVRHVAQEAAFDPSRTVFDAVADGVAEARELRRRYEAHDGADSGELDALQTRIETLGGWNWEQRVEQTLDSLHLDGARRVGDLSGGLAKRVALGQALVAMPDVLLLDEPTNHLDVDSIEWLETLLAGFRGSAVVISHDRAFLDAVATRIVELDRGRLRSYPGDFAAFERRRADELSAEALQAARADKLLAAEEVWVRKGVEARRTRAVGRIKRLETLRAERAARRDVVGRVRLEADAGAQGGRIVADLRDVRFAYDGAAPIVDGLTATILRGDKVGLIGPNGSGKTTLLKLLLGELQPTAGQLRRGTRLEVAYFDQLRGALDLEATLADSVSPGSEFVETASGRQHVIGYLGAFGFAPERARSPLKSLSGGERSRVLLARLLALPANVLVLDEPTNDLDIETLELLEELLQSYRGTVFLVSHDRRFLDHVVTSTIAWEGDVSPGRWREYEGGFEEWKRQRTRADAISASARAASAARPAPAMTPAVVPVRVDAGAAVRADAPSAVRADARAERGRKLGYQEQRELDALPARIEALELEQKELTSLLGSAEFYADDPARVESAQMRFTQIDDELTAALERWEALESRIAPLSS